MGVQNINFGAVEVSKYNNNTLSKIYFNNTLVWTAKAPAGSQTFAANGTFIVPAGITSVNICMCGGGGGGTTNDVYDCGGGRAGVVVSQNVAVTPGQSISVVVGAGGGRVGGNSMYGLNGQASKFGSITAAGGSGGRAGNTTVAAYKGNGASKVSCAGTHYDGAKATYTQHYGTFIGYGGEAGAFGNGGAGSNREGYGVLGNDGGIGAGGGGVASGSGSANNVLSSAGGRGQVVVSWD